MYSMYEYIVFVTHINTHLVQLLRGGEKHLGARARRTARAPIIGLTIVVPNGEISKWANPLNEFRI